MCRLIYSNGPDFDGVNPLGLLACRSGALLDILSEQFFERKMHSKRHASSSSDESHLVKHVLKENPMASSITNRQGRLLLHVAINKATSVANRQGRLSLLIAINEATSITGRQGRLSLHVGIDKASINEGFEDEVINSAELELTHPNADDYSADASN